MLKFAYGREVHYSSSETSLENVSFAINMFKTAAKYEIPEYKHMAVTGFVAWLNRLCAGSSIEGEGPTLQQLSNVVDTVYAIPASERLQHRQDFVFMAESAFENHCDICEPTKEAALKAFCDIIQMAYEFVGHEPQPENSLIAVSLKLIDQHDSVSIPGNTQQLLLEKAPEKVAGFGRDLLLQLLKKTGNRRTTKTVVLHSRCCILAPSFCVPIATSHGRRSSMVGMTLIVRCVGTWSNTGLSGRSTDMVVRLDRTKVWRHHET
jgi:hypothetical protein